MHLKIYLHKINYAPAPNNGVSSTRIKKYRHYLKNYGHLILDMIFFVYAITLLLVGNLKLT